MKPARPTGSGNATEQHWRDVYSQIGRQRRLYGPAYADAYAPLIAGAIDYHTSTNPTKREVRVLVIGGGKGHFSKRTLPAVLESLREIGNQTRVKVIESDITPVIRHAPRPRVKADLFNLPFADESFDFIIGESVLHTGTPQELDSFAVQAHRILRPGGVLLHMQDAVAEWWSDQPLNFSKDLPAAEQRAQMAASEAAHLRLANAIVESARKARLSAAHQVQLGIAPLTDGRIIQIAKLFAERPNANTAAFMMGRQCTLTDPSLPPDEKQLLFTGYATLAAKDADARAIIDHAYHIFAKES